MRESLYQKLERQIVKTERFCQAKEKIGAELEQHTVGLVMHPPSSMDRQMIANGRIKELIESKSSYADYLIHLAALDAAADKLKERTGCPGYTDVIYLPVNLGERKLTKPGLITEESILAAGVPEEEIRRAGRERYGLAEQYEVETVLEEELNRTVLESMYCKVYVAGRLSVSAKVYQMAGQYGTLYRKDCGSGGI